VVDGGGVSGHTHVPRFGDHTAVLFVSPSFDLLVLQIRCRWVHFIQRFVTTFVLHFTCIYCLFGFHVIPTDFTRATFTVLHFSFTVTFASWFVDFLRFTPFFSSRIFTFTQMFTFVCSRYRSILHRFYVPRWFCFHIYILHSTDVPLPVRLFMILGVSAIYTRSFTNVHLCRLGISRPTLCVLTGRIRFRLPLPFSTVVVRCPSPDVPLPFGVRALTFTIPVPLVCRFDFRFFLFSRSFHKGCSTFFVWNVSTVLVIHVRCYVCDSILFWFYFPVHFTLHADFALNRTISFRWFPVPVGTFPDTQIHVVHLTLNIYDKICYWCWWLQRCSHSPLHFIYDLHAIVTVTFDAVRCSPELRLRLHSGRFYVDFPRSPFVDYSFIHLGWAILLSHSCSGRYTITPSLTFVSLHTVLRCRFCRLFAVEPRFIRPHIHITTTLHLSCSDFTLYTLFTLFSYHTKNFAVMPIHLLFPTVVVDRLFYYTLFTHSVTFTFATSRCSYSTLFCYHVTSLFVVTAFIFDWSDTICSRCSLFHSFPSFNVAGRAFILPVSVLPFHSGIFIVQTFVGVVYYSTILNSILVGVIPVLPTVRTLTLLSFVLLLFILRILCIPRFGS